MRKHAQANRVEISMVRRTRRSLPHFKTWKGFDLDKVLNPEFPERVLAYRMQERVSLLGGRLISIKTILRNFDS